jgi:predicted permease
MFNIGVSLLNRISTLLTLKALPNEAALQTYMRCIFKGVFFLVLGSVLLGATIASALYVAYTQMISSGYSEISALATSFGTSLILLLISFILARKYLSQKLYVKLQPQGIVDEKLDYLRNIATESISGFMDGLRGK